MCHPTHGILSFDDLRLDAEYTRSPLKDYRVVNLAHIWASEIIPILDSNPNIIDIHAECVSTFIRACGTLDGCPNYHERREGIARVYTRSDMFSMEVDDRIDQALEIGNKDALRLSTIWEKLTEAALDQQATDALYEEAADIERKFHPPRNSVEYWVPGHSCFYLNLWAYYVARAWKPEGRWKLKKGAGHLTVADTKNKLIFDVLMHNYSLKDVLKEIQNRSF